MKRPTLTGTLTFVATAALLSLPFLAYADATFVPLTSLPGLDKISAAGATSMSTVAFINNLYKILIGVAAFIAVVQIAHAGYLFMSSNDSISANTKARGKIMNSVIGLILVLSPYVVFSVINPAILDVSLDFGSLKTGNGTGADAEFGALGNTGTLWADNSSSRTEAKARCDASGGEMFYVCVSKETNKGRTVPITEGCDTTKETGENVCKGDANEISNTGGSCTDYSPINTSSNGVCDGSRGYQQISPGCCTGAAGGTTCCGVKKTASSESAPK